MADKLRFDVEVNTRDGVRELDRLGDAGKQAGEDIESGMDDAASATDQVVAAIRTMSTQIDAELRETAAAADALRLALGETAERIDATEAVNEFKRMGLSADQVRADVDRLAAALREADDVDMRRMGDGIDSAKTSLGGMRGEADQSRSVLANMAGNAAQDMGALGGVAGTAGVAIGQLAEYATEGGIKLSNLAKVAGPMLALAAATALVTDAMGNQAKAKAFDQARIDAYAKSVREVGAGLEAVEQTLRETETLTYTLGQTDWNKFFGSSEGTLYLDRALGAFGITLDQLAPAIEAGGDELAKFEQVMRDAGIGGDLLADIMAVVETEHERYAGVVANTTAANVFWAETIDDVNAKLRALQNPLDTMSQRWSALIADVADGNIDVEHSVTLIEQLAKATGLTSDQVLALAKTEADKTIAGIATAAQDAAAEMDVMADNAREADTIMSGADWGAAALDGATEAFSTYFTNASAYGQQIADQEEAWDNLATTIEDAGTAVLDLQSPEGRQVWDALQQLGTSIVPELAEAWVAADGDMEAFRQSAEIISRRTLTRLTQALIDSGVGAEDAAVLAQQYIDVLGLTPEDVETQIKLAGDAEARIKLGLLQGVIDDLPEEVQTEIAMAILADDPQAALDAAQRAIEQQADLHATMVVDADVSRALNAIGNVIRAINNARILGGILAGMNLQPTTSSGPRSVEPAGATTVYVNVPRGTRPDDMVRAADRYARRNGRAHASRR